MKGGKLFLKSKRVTQRIRQGGLLLIAAAAFSLLAQPVQSFRQQTGGQKPAQGKEAEGTKPTQTKEVDKEADAAQPAQAKKNFTLKISKETPRFFALTAKNAKLTEIAGELARRLDVPVRLSPLMSQQTISELQFESLNLEATLRMLAPHPYVDYVMGGDATGQPKPLAIYLYAMNEAPPSLNETVKSNQQTLLIEGHTEEGTEEYEKEREKKEEPLRVAFSNNRLSVRAQKQPIGIVLYKVATELGIPFDLESDSMEVVDVEFNGYSVDQAMRSISPAVRFYYRADLLNFENYPIRIVLADTQQKPARTAQSN